MSTSTLHPVATAYLQQVRREGRDLPRDRLAELLIDLEEHLSAAIPADASEEAARESGRRSSCFCSVFSPPASGGSSASFCSGAREPGRHETSSSARLSSRVACLRRCCSCC